MRMSRRSVGLAAACALVATAPVAVSVSAGAATRRIDLTDPHKKDIALRLVSSAENSSLDWRARYPAIEDIGDGLGYTAGIIGFHSGTGDLLALVRLYTARRPGNPLARFIPALTAVNGTASHAGLGAPFESAWRTAAGDSVFTTAQDDERDRLLFDPAVDQARADGLRALGQFIYYDAIVRHGTGQVPPRDSFAAIRANALSRAKSPAQGGNETGYLHAFLDARTVAMSHAEGRVDLSRVETEQRVFLRAGNLDLNPPLSWQVHGESYRIAS
jgi:chitosanase